MGLAPVEATFQTDQVELVIEIWSAGNPHGERVPAIRPYRLSCGDHVAEKAVTGGTSGTIGAAPVPITLDPADLLPRPVPAGG